MKVEVDVLGSTSLINLTVSVDVKPHFNQLVHCRAQELCESRGGRTSWFPVPNKPTVSVDVKHHVYILGAVSELRSCVKIEMDVLGSRPKLDKPTVSVDVKQHFNKQHVQR